tara:strand:+ start:110 stop:343 length:234 start_codon:yes stop_codon:yes gene_type:complete
MKKPAYRGPYLNDSILNTYRNFGNKSPKFHSKFKQKIIARIIARIWYLRVQKAKQHKLAYFGNLPLNQWNLFMKNGG